jgi:hypothetical protein
MLNHQFKSFILLNVKEVIQVMSKQKRKTCLLGCFQHFFWPLQTKKVKFVKQDF